MTMKNNDGKQSRVKRRVLIDHLFFFFHGVKKNCVRETPVCLQPPFSPTTPLFPPSPLTQQLLHHHQIKAAKRLNDIIKFPPNTFTAVLTSGVFFSPPHNSDNVCRQPRLNVQRGGVFFVFPSPRGRTGRGVWLHTLRFDTHSITNHPRLSPR